MSERLTYMVRTELDRARLFDFGRERRLPVRDVDIDYVVHCVLRGLFGELAPQPFVSRDRGRALEIIGYSHSAADQLLKHAQAISDPLVWAICKEASTVSKPMPRDFLEGSTLGFEIRACPTVRKASNGPHHRQGAEVDVFLSRCWGSDEGQFVDRSVVYREWLRQRLCSSGGATVIESELLGFSRQQVVRSAHDAKRGLTLSERPVATFGGVLRVEDPIEFSRLLRRGVGRHRAFGFGMLLLKADRRGQC